MRTIKRRYLFVGTFTVVIIAIFVGIPIHWRALPFGAAVVSINLENINPHRDWNKCLYVQSRRFCHLRGEIPFYAAIPQTHEVFFVSESSTGPVWHFYNLDSRIDKTVDGSRTTLVGFTLGTQSPKETISKLNDETYCVEVNRYSYQHKTPSTTRYLVKKGENVVRTAEIIYYDSEARRTVIGSEIVDLGPRAN